MNPSHPALTLHVDARFLSPYAMCAFVALHEKSLPFELETVDLASGENRGADFSALSLTGRVPTLVHGDFALSESSAICEYLDEAFPQPPLYPRDRRARARARQVQAWLRSDLAPLRKERPTEVLFGERRPQPLSPEACASAERLFAFAGSLVHRQANLFGDWCIADFDLALMLNRLVINGDRVAEDLASYAESQWQRVAVRRWLAAAASQAAR